MNTQILEDAKQPTDERSEAEQQYTITAFDYVKNPVGSFEWTIYWKGWQARAIAKLDAKQPIAVLELLIDACNCADGVVEQGLVFEDIGLIKLHRKWQAHAQLPTNSNEAVDAEMKALKCPNPNCDDVGWFPEYDIHGNVEQCQCEFCYTAPKSIFNLRAAIDAAMK